MRKYLWVLLPVVFVSLLVFLFIFYPGLIFNKDTVYQLDDGSSVSKLKVQSFQNEIISDYNKNFERYPPNNKQFYGDFILNSSFNSAIGLTYYGEVVFCFGKPYTNRNNFVYIGKNDTKSICLLSFSPGTKWADFIEVSPVFLGRSTNVKNLTPELARHWASDFYDADYAHYIVDNANSNQNNESNDKLNAAYDQLSSIYKTGNEIEIEKSTIDFYNLAEDLNVSEDGARRLVNNLKNNNEIQASEVIQFTQSTEQQNLIPFFSLTYINFSIWDGIWALILLLVVGLAIPKISLYFKEREDQGKPETTAILRHIFDIALSVIGIGGYIGFYLWWFGKIGGIQIAICIICPFLALCLTWWREKKREPQAKKHK